MKRRITLTIPPAAIIIMTLVLSSCERVIEYQGPEMESKTVIYALLQPDSLVTVSVAESHSYLETRYKPRQIKNAVVRLYQDGQLLETLTYLPPEPPPEGFPSDYPEWPWSKYVALSARPLPGHLYRIETEISGRKKAYGEAMLPNPVESIISDTVIKEKEYGMKELTVKLRFRDPAGEENFYRFTASALTGIYYGDHSLPFDPENQVGVYRRDLSIGALYEPLIHSRQDDDFFDMTVYNQYSLFTDELIPGREYALTLKYNHLLPDVDHYEFVHAGFSISAITRELYLHLMSSAAQSQTGSNFLSEPVPVYTNITNGLGVVGAMSTSTDTLKLGAYPVEGVNYDFRLYDSRQTYP